MGVIVYYTNSNGDSFEFSDNSKVYITSIDGISANDVSLTEATVNNQVGASVTGRSIQTKDITLEGQYQYDPNIRKRLLAVILPNLSGTLRLVNTKEDVDVYWNVYPTKTPELGTDVTWQDFQITLRAPYPYARSTNTNITDFNTLSALHKFKRSYSSTTAFKLSSRNYQPLRTIVNNGSLTSGFIMKMVAETNGVIAPKITNVNTQANISFPKLTLNENDTIEVSTYENEKYCHLIKDGVTSNIFKDMDYASTFFQLDAGTNVLRYSATANEEYLDVRVSFDDTVAGV